MFCTPKTWVSGAGNGKRHPWLLESKISRGRVSSRLINVLDTKQSSSPSLLLRNEAMSTEFPQKTFPMSPLSPGIRQELMQWPAVAPGSSPHSVMGNAQINPISTPKGALVIETLRRIPSGSRNCLVLRCVREWVSAQASEGLPEPWALRKSCLTFQ